MFHQHLAETDFALACVVVSYILFLIAYGLMIYKAHKEKSYPASLLTICSQFGMALICVVGPFTAEKDLFYKPAESPQTFLVWIACLIAWIIMFIQYLRYAHVEPNRFPELSHRHHQIAWGVLIATIVTEWLFIVFSRDYYVNETWPLATLIMALGFYLMLVIRPKLRGLSLSAAWTLFVATVLLYIGSGLAGDGMAGLYPCHSSMCMGQIEELVASGAIVIPKDCPPECFEASGFGFMYWTFALGSIMLLAYAVMLTRRREELREDYDFNKTIERWRMRPS